jgi:S-DNA-T family DNA segregation ATPase FtsK/SpoIIIE
MSRSIRPYLEYQADRVEAVLAAHRAPGRVTRGTVGPRLIRFVLNPAPHIRFAAIKRLADDLALAMRVPNLSISREQDGIVLEFCNPDPHPVTLLGLLPEVLPLPVSAAVLGLTDEGLPLLARLAAPEVTHILIAGTTGSGKSVLMQSIAASLVLTHSPQVVRMLCIDPKGHTFQEFKDVPHLTRPPVTTGAEAQEALRSVVRTMEVRDRRGERPVTRQQEALGYGIVPRVVVFIDELADLIMQGDAPVTESITRLVQRGRQAGVHVVAATQHPSSSILSSVIRANFPLRLIGKVVSATDARVASGRGGTDAHLLEGRGDFLAVSGGDTPIRFQAASIDMPAFRREVQALRPTQVSQRKALPAPAQLARGVA